MKRNLKRPRWLGAVCLLVFASGLVLLLPPAREAVRLAVAKPPVHLTVPVRGVPAAALHDEWRASPGTILGGWREILAGGRRHHSVDIRAEIGTPVVAPTHGVVLSVGSWIVRLLGPGGQVHTFAHIHPCRSLHVGLVVEPGDVLGDLSDTRTPRGVSTFLRYGVYAPPGTPIDPVPLLLAPDRPVSAPP